ncbi:DUF3093 family protein [Streptomyces sp. NPDC005355]|uniref:DUF3093 family protein n=1 Tax=Streptomyces sp. NPDC005355 TaxID=3157038 RepID=UPI0033B86D9F
MYKEKVSKTWSVICVTVYVVGVAWMGIDAGSEDLGAWLAVSALFLLLLVAFMGVPISKYIYNKVEIDQQTLRVGRERIPLTEFDPGSVAASLQAATSSRGQRFMTSAAAVDAPTPGLRAADRGESRIVGGGWGVPLGMDSVVIRTRTGEGLRIATRDPQAFLAALALATGVRH